MTAYPVFSFDFCTLPADHLSIWVFTDPEKPHNVLQHWLPDESGKSRAVCFNCPTNFGERCALCLYRHKRIRVALKRKLAVSTRIYLNALRGEEATQAVLTLSEKQWSALRPVIVRYHWMVCRPTRDDEGWTRWNWTIAGPWNGELVQLMNLPLTVKRTTLGESEAWLEELLRDAGTKKVGKRR